MQRGLTGHAPPPRRPGPRSLQPCLGPAICSPPRPVGARCPATLIDAGPSTSGRPEPQITRIVSSTEAEESRQYRRTVFAHEDWERHRDTTRYTRHISGILSSRVARGLLQPIAWVMACSSAISTYEFCREEGYYIPSAFPRLAVDSSQAFSLTSFALSLLLVFRTNASYARWDEARKVWASILNRTRDLNRQALAWLHPEDAHTKAMMTRWTLAFSRCLMSHVRKDVDLGAELKVKEEECKILGSAIAIYRHWGVLDADEAALVLAANNRPAFVLRVLTEVLAGARLSSMDRHRMDDNITRFQDALGACASQSCT